MDLSVLENFKPQFISLFKEKGAKSLVVSLTETETDFKTEFYKVNIPEYMDKIQGTISDSKLVIDTFQGEQNNDREEISKLNIEIADLKNAAEKYKYHIKELRKDLKAELLIPKKRSNGK